MQPATGTRKPIGATTNTVIGNHHRDSNLQSSRRPRLEARACRPPPTRRRARGPGACRGAHASARPIGGPARAAGVALPLQ